MIRDAYLDLQQADHPDRDQFSELWDEKGDFSLDHPTDGDSPHERDRKKKKDKWGARIAGLIGGLMLLDWLTGGGGSGGGGAYGKPGAYTNSVYPGKGVLGPRRGSGPGTGGVGGVGGGGPGATTRRESEPREPAPERIERKNVSLTERKEALESVKVDDVEGTVSHLLTSIDNVSWRLPAGPDGENRGEVAVRRYGPEDFSLYPTKWSEWNPLRRCLDNTEGPCEMELEEGVSVSVASFDQTNRRFVVPMDSWKAAFRGSAKLPILVDASSRRPRVEWVSREDYEARRSEVLSDLDEKRNERWDEQRPQPGTRQMRPPGPDQAEKVVEALGADANVPLRDSRRSK